MTINNIKLNLNLETMGEVMMVFNGQEFIIPYRVYNTEIEINNYEISLMGKYALLTRHNDGFIREKYIKLLVKNFEPDFYVPFAYLLLSEYILSIIEFLKENLDNYKFEMLKLFRENENFYQLLESRITSYWNAYYRTDYHDFKEYPGYRIINELEKLIN